MSFETLRAIPVGQYIPAGTFIHRLDPRARILAVILLLTGLIICRQPVALAVLLVLLVIVATTATIPLRTLVRSLLGPLPFLAILAVLQVFINPYPDEVVLFIWGSLVLSVSDLLAGLVLLLRFSGLVTILVMASHVITTSEINYGISRLLKPLEWVHFPVHDLVMVFMVTLRFIPLLALTIDRIAKAQASRGADWTTTSRNPFKLVRRVLPLLVPLFIQALQKAERMALALDARGYSSLAPHTSMHEYQFKMKDTVIVILVLLLTVGMVAANYL